MSVEDIDNMVTLSRDLYERCVILRYKAFEQKVFDNLSEGREIAVAAPTIEATKNPAEPIVNQEIDFGIF